MITETPRLSKESTGFYWPDATPYEGKRGKKRPKEVVPSVTKISRLVYNFGLENWKLDRTIGIAYDVAAGEELWDKQQFTEEVRERTEAELSVASDRGKELHGAIERFIQGVVYKEDNVWMQHFNAVKQSLQNVNIDIFDGKAEHSFVNERYGGKVDWHDKDIVDFKTKDRLYYDGKLRKLAYFEHLMQLVAYKRGLDLSGEMYNCFIGAEDQAVHIHHWDDPVEQARAWKAFSCLLDYWWTVNT